MVDSLEVHCPQKERGCTHTCQKHLLPTHLRQDCEYTVVGDYGERDAPGCEACGKLVYRKDWKVHLESDECSIKRPPCRWCGTKLRGRRRSVGEDDDKDSELARHERHDCPKAPVVCHHCEEPNLQRDQLATHLTDRCPEVPVACSRARFGCKWVGPRKRCPAGTLLEAEDLPGEICSDAHNCPLEGLDAFFAIYDSETTLLRQQNASLHAQLRSQQDQLQSVQKSVMRCADALGAFMPRADAVIQTTQGRPRTQSLASLASDRRSSTSPANSQQGTSPTASNGAGSSAAINMAERSRSLSELPTVSSSGISRPRSVPLAHSVPTSSLLSEDQWRTRSSESRSDPAFPPQRASSSRSPYAAPDELLWPTDFPTDDLDIGSASTRGTSPVATRSNVGVGGLDLTNELASLRATLDDLCARVRTSEVLSEKDHLASVNASFEAARAREELQSVRHVVGAVRLQMHQVSAIAVGWSNLHVH